MSKIKGSTYEILFRSGATLILENVKDVNLEFENRRISKFNVSGTPTGDALKFINIGEIVAVNKKGRKRGIWKR
jgi:hypothetical protein